MAIDTSKRGIDPNSLQYLLQVGATLQPNIPPQNTDPLPAPPDMQGTMPQGGPMSVQQPDPRVKAQQILDMLRAAQQRKQMANTVVPSPVPGMTDPNAAERIGMNTAWPHAWGTQRFLAGLSGNIRNAIAAKKQAQLAHAESKFSYVASAMNELFAAQQSGDQKAIDEAQKKVDSVFMNDKDLKSMYKALNQDWMNPEKTTVWKVALDNQVRKQKEEEQQLGKKQQAAQGLKSIFQKLIGQRQQPQLSDEQRLAMAREIEAKAPTTHGVADPKAEAEMIHAGADLIRAERSNPEKYEFQKVKVTLPDGSDSETIFALDKTDPTKPAIPVKTQAGEAVKPAGKKFPNEGKIETNRAGMPSGRVMHDGEWVAPGDPKFTKKDQEAVDMNLKAQGFSIAQSQRLAVIRATTWAREKARFMFNDVVDKETGIAGRVSALDMATSAPGRYTGASEQEKISLRDSVHESLNTNFKAMADSLDQLPNGLDTETQAVIKLALRSDDRGILETLIANKVKQNEPQAVIQVITNIKAMQEDVMTLRAVGGMAGASDMLRNAIVGLVPGAGTSSVMEGKMQLAAARRTAEALFSGRPQSRLPANTGTIHYREGEKTNYYIPIGLESEFMKAHPKAVKVQ